MTNTDQNYDASNIRTLRLDPSKRRPPQAPRPINGDSMATRKYSPRPSAKRPQAPQGPAEDAHMRLLAEAKTMGYPVELHMMDGVITGVVHDFDKFTVIVDRADHHRDIVFKSSIEMIRINKPKPTESTFDADPELPGDNIGNR